MIDDIVWEGPGSSLPDRCWTRHGVILRTLDIVAYKVLLFSPWLPLVALVSIFSIFSCVCDVARRTGRGTGPEARTAVH